MTKERLIKNIAREFSLDEVAVAEFIDAIFDTLTLVLSKGKNVTINEFGKFRVQKKRDGERIIKKLIFTPVKKFADQINSNYNNLPIVKLRVVDSKSLSSIPEIGEKEFVYIMEDEVIMSADMFEESESESKFPPTQNLEIGAETVEEKDFSRDTAVGLSGSEEVANVTDVKLSDETPSETREFPIIEESYSPEKDKEFESTSLELKEESEKKQNLFDEMSEFEKRGEEPAFILLLEKLSQHNVEGFDISEKTIVDNNELIDLIGKSQNIFLTKEDITIQQSSQAVHIDEPLTFAEERISDTQGDFSEDLSALEEKISHLPSVETSSKSEETQPAEKPDTSTEIESITSLEDSIKSLQDAFEEIKVDEQTEVKQSSPDSTKPKELEDSPFKPIDYTPPVAQEELKNKMEKTTPFTEPQGKKALNPYLKLGVIFLLIILLLLFIAILF